MNDDLNKIVLTKILKAIPENIKPVNLFMDILDLGKESAYRRLRGDKVLSFEDIYKLTSELGLSVEELIEDKKSNSFVFNYIGDAEQSPETNFLKFLKYYEQLLISMINAENSQSINTLNHLINVMLVDYEDLFKFVYFRWIHQVKDIALNFKYSDFEVPDEIKKECKKLASLQYEIKKVTYIIDKNLFLNLVKEMQYFYKRGILDENHLNLLKVDYLRYMDTIERIVHKGSDNNGAIYEIYLSVFNIDNTVSYNAWDDNEELGFWHTNGFPAITRNKQVISVHKAWINSMKKYATVISQSNELLQAEFFNQQRSYVDNITDTILL